MEILFDKIWTNANVAATVILIELIVAFMTSLAFAGATILAAFPPVILIAVFCLICLTILNAVAVISIMTWLVG